MPMYVYLLWTQEVGKESDDEESSEEESDDEDEDKKTKEAAGDGDGEASETGKGEPGSDSGGSSKEFEMVKSTLITRTAAATKRLLLLTKSTAVEES